MEVLEFLYLHLCGRCGSWFLACPGCEDENALTCTGWNEQHQGCQKRYLACPDCIRKRPLYCGPCKIIRDRERKSAARATYRASDSDADKEQRRREEQERRRRRAKEECDQRREQAGQCTTTEDNPDPIAHQDDGPTGTFKETVGDHTEARFQSDASIASDKRMLDAKAPLMAATLSIANSSSRPRCAFCHREGREVRMGTS